MTSRRVSLLSAFVFLLVAGAFYPQSASSVDGSVEQGTASLTVTTPLVVGPLNRYLNFGSLIPGNSAGTVTIDAPEGKRVPSGVTLVGDNGQIATFYVSGGPSSVVTPIYINVPPHVTVGSRENSMTVDLNSTYPTAMYDGRTIVAIGGTLHVGPNQPAGNYTSAPFDVTVSY